MSRFVVPRIHPSEITDEKHFWDRRTWLATVGGAIGTAFAVDRLAASPSRRLAAQAQDTPTPYETITHYNNYYEFSTDKESVAELAENFRTTPWTVSVEGEVKRPKRYALADLLRGLPVVDRTYRHRCVEAWSMVIPWSGVELGALIRRLEPTSKAKYVEFTTLLDPQNMPGQNYPSLHWPYVEGLRLDEAMHPLAIFATGIYNKPLLPQNGAPLRLVTPWKYGFKGIKSIVRIRLTDTQPITAWSRQTPNEYGFYANVNPTVDHPRWSQATHRMVGEIGRRPTLMFNGYSEVASLYSGMDLKKNY